MALPTKDSLLFGLARCPDQNPKEAKKTKSDFLDFIV
jgi:hypothetical protein